jgi:hypothetical protein
MSLVMTQIWESCTRIEIEPVNFIKTLKMCNTLAYGYNQCHGVRCSASSQCHGLGAKCPPETGRCQANIGLIVGLVLGAVVFIAISIYCLIRRKKIKQQQQFLNQTRAA